MVSTLKENDYLNFIKTFWQENLYAPNVREISDGLGVNSTSVVHRHLDKLKDKGLVIFQPNIARTLRLANMTVEFNDAA